ncbi:MAG: outer membrane beta-barrel protein [Elusimicrobiota bacterium]|nr:MAG: outer membrane beta-barrel protein [Elusimicrobiota bacterium]
MRLKIRAVAVLAVVSLLAQSAQAVNMNWLTQYKKPNIHWGQLAIHPYYQLTEMYQSNIYLVPRDTPTRTVGGGVRGSWITKNELAVETILPWRNLHELKAGYGAEAHSYTTQPDLNDTINQRAHLDYAYKGAYGLTFRAGDQYIHTRDQAFSQLVDRDRRWANTVYTSLDYDPEGGRMAGGVDASHMVNKYLGAARGRELNRYEQRAGFNVGYKIQPKTKLYASYHRGIIHYTVGRQLPDQDKNSKSHDLGFGVNGQLTPKMTGQVEGGMTYREYDEAPIGGATRVTRNFTVATGVTYRPSNMTDIVLNATRRLEESINASSRFYISNTVSLDVKHKFPYKFSAGLNGAFGLDKYPDSQTVLGGATGTRRDDIYQGGAWVEYDIQQWLSTGVSYVFRERNSTFSGEFNYQDMQTAWNLAVKF